MGLQTLKVLLRELDAILFVRNPLAEVEPRAEELKMITAPLAEETHTLWVREVGEAKEAVLEMPEELKMIFDTDGSGNLGPDKLAQLLRDLDFDADDVIVSDIMRRIDANNDGHVDLLEMAEWWHECEELMNRLIEALDSNDPDALEKAIKHGQRQVFPFPRTSRFRFRCRIELGSPNLIPNTDTFYVRSPR